VNVAPVATDNSYSGAGVVAGNVFTDGTPDSDADFGPTGRSNWKAVLVNSAGVPVSTPAGLTFNANGTFSYNTAGGSLTFYYRIDTGTWTDGTTTVDMSPDSNVAKVTITVPPPADGEAPKVTITSVTPSVIWSPNGKKVAVTVTGTATDNVGVTKLALDVVDEYGQDQPHMEWPPNSTTVSYNTATGKFSFVVSLTASRLGNDKDGRMYTLTVSAKDSAGNTGTGAPVRVTAHDQSK
jgi:hypothetical protein